jgi:hypothetical protein
MTFYADPRASYQFGGRPGAFADLRQGVSVSVTYDVRDKRNLARRVVGGTRNK